MCNLKYFQLGAVSGSSDKTVKIWKFELVPDPTGNTRARVLSLLHTRTLELQDAVLCVKVSPNSKFIAVGLLDSTVKIFFLDTFKVNINEKKSLFSYNTRTKNNIIILVLFIAIWT